MAPHQSPETNPNKRFKRFEPQRMRRGGEPASVVAMIGAAVAQFELDRVYLTDAMAAEEPFVAAVTAWPGG